MRDIFITTGVDHLITIGDTHSISSEHCGGENK
jgi:hypothetical protein